MRVLLLVDVCHQQRDAILKVHYEDGFKMLYTDTDRREVILWQYSFSQLKRSSDEGNILRLYFFDDELKVSLYSQDVGQGILGHRFG